MEARRSHLALLLVAASWGMVFVGIHELVPVLRPVQLVTIRFGIIALTFLVLLGSVPALRVFPRGRGDWTRFVVCGLLTVPGVQLCQVYAQNYLSPQLSSLVVSTSPVITAILAALFLDEVFTPVRVVGSLVALLGVALIVAFGTHDSGSHPGFGWQSLLIIICPVAWAAYTAMSRPLAGRYPAVATVGISVIIGTLVVLPFASSTLHALPLLSAADWGWMVFLVLGGSLLPYLVWFWALRHLQAGLVASYMYPIPAFAMLFSWLILRLPPSTVAWIGASCVLFGVLLTQAPLRIVLHTFAWRPVRGRPRQE